MLNSKVNQSAIDSAKYFAFNSDANSRDLKGTREEGRRRKMRREEKLLPTWLLLVCQAKVDAEAEALVQKIHSTVCAYLWPEMLKI